MQFLRPHILTQSVNNQELATNGDMVCGITETYEKASTHLRGEWSEGLPRPELHYSASEWKLRMRASDWILNPPKECWRLNIFNLLPSHRRLPARPAVYFTVSTKKRRLTATLPFWYKGYFLSTENLSGCTWHLTCGNRHCGYWVWLPKLSDWMKAVSKSGAGGKQMISVVFYFCINLWLRGCTLWAELC